MSKIKLSVVEAIIKDKSNRILLLKRSEKNKYYVGKWQLPGGKVELGEKIDAAIKRELLEETGVKYKNLKLSKIFCLNNEYSTTTKKNILLLVFETKLLGNIKISKDHVEYKFFSIRELKEESLTKVSKKAIFG